ncbi:conserved exported hypothetical protein [Vibrio aestuarianus]|nr:conserved exported hypothetical protein [Vibrio aestuarianus]
MKLNSLVFATIAACATSQAANLDTTSREYKGLLEPTLFTFQTEQANVKLFSQELAATISQAIDRDVTGVAALDKERTVTYWDASGSCELKRLDYSFRDRVNIYDITDRDAALKVRKADRFVSGYEDLSSSETDFETKMEEDLLINNKLELVVKHSHSTKINSYTENIGKFDDIYHHFPGFKAAYGTIDPELALVAVGQVHFYERRYKGQIIDLGKFDADIVISLWYTSATPQPEDTPVVAEVSFDYSDPEAQYTQKVVQRAAGAIFAIAGMTQWVNLNAQTKTDFAYSYDPNFCTSAQ